MPISSSLAQVSSLFIAIWQKIKLNGSETRTGLVVTTVWQAANYLLPLITFPYLARHLGVASFGVIGIGVAITAYAQLLTEWGFGFSATQIIAKNRENPAARVEIFWDILAARTFLGLCSSFILILFTAIFVKNGDVRSVIYVSLLAVLATAWNVDWYLRGLGRMTEFALASVIGRLAALPFVFLLVHQPADTTAAAFAGAMGPLLASMLSIAMAWRVGIGRPETVSFRRIWASLVDGGYLFLTVLMINLYTSFLTVGLSLVASVEEVGIFSGANKIRGPITALLQPLTMVFYPQMSFLAASNRGQAENLAIKLFWLFVCAGTMMAIGTVLLAPVMVPVLMGRGFETAIPVLRLMSVLILIISVNIALSNLIMLPFEMKRHMTVGTVVGAVIGLSVMLPLSYRFGAIGATWAAIFAEFGVLATFWFYIKRHQPWFQPFSKSFLQGLPSAFERGA